MCGEVLLEDTVLASKEQGCVERGKKDKKEVLTDAWQAVIGIAWRNYWRPDTWVSLRIQRHAVCREDGILAGKKGQHTVRVNVPACTPACLPAKLPTR